MNIQQISIHHLRPDTVRRLIEDPSFLTTDQVFVSASGQTLIIQVCDGPLNPAAQSDLFDVWQWAKGHNLDYIELANWTLPEPDLRDYEREAKERVAEAAPELLAALKALFADYKQLADSGDAGWTLENQPVGQQALAAIAKAEGAQALLDSL